MDAQLPEHGSAEDAFKDFVRRLVAEAWPAVAVNVRGQQIQVGLLEVVETGALWADRPDELVIAFQLGFLIGHQRVAIEDEGPVMLFKCRRLGKLGAIVS